MQEVWGIGRRINLHLSGAGIKTVKALRDTPAYWLRARFGEVFVQTNYFRGQDKQYSNCITVPLPNASSDTRLLIWVALFGLSTRLCV